MSIVRIDPEGRRNAKHIAIIIVVDHVPIQSHFRSRRPQAQQLTGERSLPWLPRSREARWSCSP